jgi:hypothetical protein
LDDSAVSADTADIAVSADIAGNERDRAGTARWEGI